MYALAEFAVGIARYGASVQCDDAPSSDALCGLYPPAALLIDGAGGIG